MSAPPAAGVRASRRGRAGRLLVRAWALAAGLLARSRPGARTAEPGLDDALAIYAPDAGPPVALVTLLGLDAEERTAALAAATATLGRSHRIICVTDAGSFGELRRAGALVEQVPARDEQLRHAPELPWSDYLRDRYDLLIAKWRPAVVLAYGDSFERAIERAGAHERHLA